MRHRVHYKAFGRRRGHREALIRNLVVSLVDKERIRTTVEKAKELRRHVEKAITKGKDNSLHVRRILLSRFPNIGTVEKIMTDLSKRFSKRPGGYTRIVKLGKRPGDLAEMAFIEFVDYKKAESKEGAKGKKETKEAKEPKVSPVSKEAHKKNLRKIQAKARRVSRELNA